MEKILFIYRYVKYLFKARGKHVAQAPFLYDFITTVLYQHANDQNCIDIDSLRKNLCKSKDKLNITDFGAGSHVNINKIRRIKDIAKNSAKNAKFGKLLYRIIQKYKPKKILELGTSLGISTLYLAKADKNASIYTFEGCPETAKIAEQNFEKLYVRNVDLTIGNFNETLSKKINTIENIDLAFIDGNHQEEPTINYFEKCLKYSNNDTIFIFDDIHWSAEMEKAWEYIKAHHKTTLTIDIFFVGIVFLKKELSKENFIIQF